MKLLEIAVRILCDVPAGDGADAVFLYSQTADNQSSVLSAAHRLLAKKRVRKVLITDSGPKSGYPGYGVWAKALVNMGVPEASIAGVDLRKADSLNTLIEANAMMGYVKEQKYNNIYVTASPFHQLRAFMTSVTAAQACYPGIKIYSSTGNPLPWQEIVSHSQGETAGSRKDLVGGEFERIRKYQQKGDLADDTEILRYLNQRDV